MKEPRVNDRISAPRVRVVGENGEQIGVIPSREALDMARERGLDLVEVAPQSEPPVCKFMDYGKYRYEKSKKERINKKKQISVQLKEIRLRPKTDDHAFDFKLRHIKEFLSQGKKVKVYVHFRGREMVHQELGGRLLRMIKEQVGELGGVAQEPKLEGRNLIMILNPVTRRKGEKSAKAEEQKGSEEEV